MVDPLGAVEADASTADGSVEVVLSTALGEATITVPPLRKWRGSARHALFMRADDVTWANTTLSPKDAASWRECDPDTDELEDFLVKWTGLVGEDAGKYVASKPSSKATRKR